MMGGWNELPKEIQIQVLGNLPVRDLKSAIGSGTSLSTVITSPSFMGGVPPSETGYHIYSYCTSDGKQTFWLCKDSRFTHKSTLAEVPVNINHSLIGYSCGLACFANVYHIEELTLVVWNPYLGKSLTIPIPLSPGEAKRDCPHALGFGYDSSCLDFKVIRIGILPFDNSGVKADVYSLFAGTHKTVIGSVRRPVLKVMEQGVYVNGAMHWLLKINPNCAGANQGSSSNPSPRSDFTILTYDLAKGKFSEMDVVNYVAHKNMALTKLVVSGVEKLAIYHNDKICNVWVMEEYGASGSWNKLCSVDCTSEGYGKVLNSWTDEQVVVWMSSTSALKLYNPHNQVMAKINYKGKENCRIIDYVGPYFRTLVFPKLQPIGE